MIDLTITGLDAKTSKRWARAIEAAVAEQLGPLLATAGGAAIEVMRDADLPRDTGESQRSWYAELQPASGQAFVRNNARNDRGRPYFGLSPIRRQLADRAFVAGEDRIVADVRRLLEQLAAPTGELARDVHRRYERLSGGS